MFSTATPRRLVPRLGHQAVPAILATFHGPERGKMSTGVAFRALAMIAQPQDAPALRELLLSGRTGAAEPLGRLQSRVCTEATDALLEAVAAGEFDEPIAVALRGAQDRTRVVNSVRAWIAAHPENTDEQRAQAADLLGALGPAAAAETVPTLEAWLAAAEKPWEISSESKALTRLGSRKGLETLLRLVADDYRGGKCGCRCCVDKPAPAVPAGSLCAEGFGVWERWPATVLLARVLGPEVFDLPTEAQIDAARDAARKAGREPESTEQLIARATAAFHEWWAASKDRVTFDAAAGRWSAGK